MNRLRIAFMVSGTGTLFETIATRCREGSLDADPVLVICSNPKAGALDRARRLEVSAVVMRREEHPDEATFVSELISRLEKCGANLVCLAGYLKLVPASVVQAFRGRMLNIHPALLPAFGGHGMYGRRVHEAVLAAGATVSGATVHLVDEQYDHGPIVLQRKVPVLPDDTVETLETRVHAIEHDLYVDAIRLFAEGRVKLAGREAVILREKP